MVSTVSTKGFSRTSFTSFAAKVAATKVEARAAKILTPAMIGLFDRVIERAEQEKISPDEGFASEEYRWYTMLADMVSVDMLAELTPHFIRYCKVLKRNQSATIEPTEEMPEEMIPARPNIEAIVQQHAYDACCASLH